MSDVDVMAAIIDKHGEDYNPTFRNYDRISSSSAKKAARALYGAGFRMAVDDTDTTQNDALKALQARVARLEGWSGLPAYWEVS